MIAQKCPPSLRWRPSAPDHVLGNSGLGDLEPELEQFTMDARSTPQWVLLAHPLDEFAYLWPTARFPAPIGPKPCSMPPVPTANSKRLTEPDIVSSDRAGTHRSRRH